MKTAALIPCRKNSKGIPNKNFKEIAGAPLWYWTAKAAYETKIFEKIILSSDGGFRGLNVWLKEWPTNGIVFDNERPGYMATDDANLDELLFHYHREHQDVELWALLQPTSPLRSAGDIRKAHKMVLQEKYDSVVSVVPDPMMYWIKNATSQGHLATYHIHKRPNRQRRKDFFRETGAIYFVKDHTLKILGLRIGGTVGLCVMPKSRALEIDDMDDWKMAEFLMNGKR